MRQPPYHLNVIGDFFVENDCCLHCGVPESEAPELFGNDGESCFVKKQPATIEETEHMLNAVSAQDLNCIRYKGSDLNLLARLAKIDEGAHIATNDSTERRRHVTGTRPLIQRLRALFRGIRARK